MGNITHSNGNGFCLFDLMIVGSRDGWTDFRLSILGHRDVWKHDSGSYLFSAYFVCLLIFFKIRVMRMSVNGPG